MMIIIMMMMLRRRRRLQAFSSLKTSDVLVKLDGSRL